MVDAALDRETSDRFHALNTLAWAVRIKPNLSPRKVQRAFNDVTRRHDSLRLRIAETAGEWVAQIHAQHPAGLVIEDHGPFSHDDQMKIVAEKCRVPMTALDPVLFEMHLLRFGDEGDVILTRGHHAIMDAYSVSILMEEAIAGFLNIPVAGSAVSHTDFVDRRARLSNQRAEEKKAYWEHALLPAPEPLNLGRQKKGLPPLTRVNMGPTVRLDNFLTEDAAARVHHRFQTSGATAFSQIQAVFGDSVCALGGGEHAMWLSILGRQDAKLSRFVGAEMQALRMKYAARSGAKTLNDAMSRSADMVPAGCFGPDTPLGQLYYQFFVNIPKPLGRLKNSPLGKALGSSGANRFSMGPIEIENLTIPETEGTDYELRLLVGPDPDHPNASFLADAASWDFSELEDLAATMNEEILL